MAKDSEILMKMVYTSMIIFCFMADTIFTQAEKAQEIAQLLILIDQDVLTDEKEKQEIRELLNEDVSDQYVQSMKKYFTTMIELADEGLRSLTVDEFHSIQHQLQNTSQQQVQRLEASEHVNELEQAEKLLDGTQ